MSLSLSFRINRAPQVGAPFKQLYRRVASRRVALALLVAAFPVLSGGASAVAKSRTKAKTKPAVTSAQVKNVSGGSAAGATRFTLVLGGRGFGKDEGDISVSLIAPNVPDPLKDTQESLVIDSQIVVSAEAAHGTYVLVVKKGGAAIDTSDIAGVTIPGAPATANDPTGTPRSPAAAASQKPFYVDFETQPYPSNTGMMRYGLVVKSDDGKFAADPKLMTVQIWPAGASDVVIRSATARRLHVDFWAPEKFEVKGVDVSVSDPSNPLRIAVVSTNEKEKEKAKPAPPQEPKIDSTEVVFLHRHQGVGRLKIEGSGFGEEHARPPLSSEAFLMNCQHQASKALKTQYLANNQTDARLTQTPPAECGAWQAWEKNIRDSVKLTLVPRNVDLRIEQTQILYIDDKLIDVYFEFSNYGGYSEPLRLARTTLTVRKNVAPKTAAPAKPQAADGAVAAADGSVPAHGFIAVSSRLGSTSGAGDAAGSGGAAAADAAPAAAPAPEWKTFLATKEVGLKQDANLQYHYTVLDNSQTDRLFGSGVSRTFYAIQLSVTNRGAKKVIVPLSSIEAEIEWAYAETPQAFFEQGPATIAPQPLDTVTAFFDANNKVKGKSARLFNIFEGMTTLGSSLIPLFGPGFKDAHVIFTGGLVPGVRKGIGDLSGQQLQNLAGMSWQNVEEVSPNGGSINKYVFIQRGDQLFGDNIENAPTKKRIKNISGVELVGFEVVESEPKAGTQVK